MPKFTMLNTKKLFADNPDDLPEELVQVLLITPGHHIVAG